jgi:altronate dehydratase
MPTAALIRGELGVEQVAVRLHSDDNVAIAKLDLQVGTALFLESQEEPIQRFSVRQGVPTGHKLAVKHILAGEPILRYGQVIGLASRTIQPGDHVHIHNVGLQDFARKEGVGADRHSVLPCEEGRPRTFLGYRRAGGQAGSGGYLAGARGSAVGTRNYVAVLSTVNCSAHVTREIARHFTPERMAAFPNVDGVVAFTHHSGCTFRAGSRDYDLLQRTLAGIARHPNVGAYLLVGLGCETNQIGDLVEHCGLCLPEGAGLVVQELGGTRRTIEAGIAAVERLLPQVNALQRSSEPISELLLALQCGGSDGWSGVTANPVVGLVADQVVGQGGTVVLAETPELYGAEHLLAHRAVSPEVARKLLDQVQWWREHARRLGMLVDDNRSVGNTAGGLTTIYEKSLGAVAKAGHTPLVDVVDYAQPVTARGLVFMNSPGYDPVSVTGQVAGGCNLVLFTTGRGSVFGFKPAPSIKIASNSALYRRMPDDMDLNAGQILDGESLEELAAKLLDLVIAVASGQPSKSEALDVGEAEFAPWYLGGML